MVSSRATEAAVTKATNKHKQTGNKRVKTRAEKDAHNAICVNSRLKKKMRYKELEKVETEYFKILAESEEMRTENQRMNMELNEKNSKLQCMENEMQRLKRALEEQAQEWFTSHSYEQGSDYTNITASYAGSSFVANHDFPSLFDAPNNNLLSHELAADDK
ncbi:uncharacterized protein LOC111307783 [Durio zibethinus]|uniref:Uncharacterized protein LOC111307783 n=1 Tax=Durio zibethinus TaxID=66656 RepID=A0A6P6AA79_DURZI|nr:uncharacterized protein LOC111307783 [Durio zibethinus]XP_022761747.1 uncharacterized protein LOC111307783 [Durio zibethinus]